MTGPQDHLIERKESFPSSLLSLCLLIDERAQQEAVELTSIATDTAEMTINVATWDNGIRVVLSTFFSTVRENF